MSAPSVDALRSQFHAALAAARTAADLKARPQLGRRHPLTQVRERVEDIFLAMGYQVIEGQESATV